MNIWLRNVIRPGSLRRLFRLEFQPIALPDVAIMIGCRILEDVEDMIHPMEWGSSCRWDLPAVNQAVTKATPVAMRWKTPRNVSYRLEAYRELVQTVALAGIVDVRIAGCTGGGHRCSMSFSNFDIRFHTTYDLTQ